VRGSSDDAAHELRTPLTAIKTNIQVALLGLRNHAPLPLVERSMANAEAGASRLQATLESLLLLARVEAGDDDSATHMTDVLDTLRQSVRELGSSMGAMDRVVVTPPSDSSSASVNVPQHSRVGNTEPAGKCLATCTVRYRRRYGHRADRQPRVRLFVVDRGPGLSPDQIKHATERFWRCNPSVEEADSDSPSSRPSRPSTEENSRCKARRPA
jgi:signal transduction histidine kinase